MFFIPYFFISSKKILCIRWN